MFRIAASVTVRTFAVILTAGAAQSANLPADLAQLDQITPVTVEIAESVDTASYCTWVLTFEEGTTEKPAWCTDDAANEG